jgi:hypothetical protein
LSVVSLPEGYGKGFRQKRQLFYNSPGRPVSLDGPADVKKIGQSARHFFLEKMEKKRQKGKQGPIVLSPRPMVCSQPGPAGTKIRNMKIPYSVRANFRFLNKFYPICAEIYY